jgi:membrane-bound lytic murein transglycosylase D
MMLLRQKISLGVVLPTGLALLIMCTGLRAESDPFPVYPCIQSNLSFWEKIYSEYSSDQGVIHDKRNLDIIYGVIDLKDPDQPGGRKINRQRIKAAKNKYRSILAKMMRGKSALEPEEQRIADLFGPEAKPADYRAATRNIRCQVGQKDRFREGIIRSGAYLEEMLRIFRENGLPEDLAYLPHVESSFNPKAYSKFGAAGIWQFTRSTGRRYLTVGYAVDERRDPFLSSHAAARLLNDTYDKFENWPMAITAYNHGTPGMLRAQRIKGSYDAIVSEYRSRIFRFASRNFYSEFLAARKVAKNYRQYFGDLSLDRPFESTEIVLAGYASLPEIARHLKLDPAVLHELNPALRVPVLRGQKYVPKGYRLRLPAESGQDWDSRIAEFSPQLFRQSQKHSHIYTVRQGDTAGEIARMHGVALDELIAANNLDARATVYVDQNLRIPLPEEKKVELAELQTVPSRSTARAQTPASDSVPLQPETGATDERLIAADDRVTSQAEPENGVVESSLSQPTEKTIEPEILPADLAVEPVRYEQDKPMGIIRVEAEETLGHYAEWLEVSTWEIRHINGFKYGTVIRLNQQVKIPLQRVSKEEFEEKRFEYHKELTEDFFAAYRIEKIDIYYIKKGDNIWTLSREEFEVPLWLIKRYNTHLDFNALTPSQRLLVPVVEKNV